MTRLGGLLLFLLISCHAGAETVPAVVRPADAPRRSLLMVVASPAQPLHVQRAHGGSGPLMPTNVAGADPVSQVVGNIIGLMIVNQMVQREPPPSGPETAVLTAFFESEALAGLVMPGIADAFREQSIPADVRGAGDDKAEAVARKTLATEPPHAGVIAVTPEVRLNDTLKSLRVVYACVGWLPSGTAKRGRPDVTGSISIIFDVEPAEIAGNQVRQSGAGQERLRALMQESGRMLAGLVVRIMRQPFEPLAQGALVIATTTSQEKVRGYRQQDLDGWTVIVDGNNNYHALKPRKLYVVKQEI